MLACLNASLVAIHPREKRDGAPNSSLTSTSTLRFPVNQLDPISAACVFSERAKRGTQGDEHIVSANDEYIYFDLDCNNIFQDYTTFSILALVSRIDIINQMLWIKIPWTSDNSLPFEVDGDIVTQRVSLVRGNVQFPSSLLFCGETCTAPYLSTEISGSGSGQLATRSNVKRKSRNDFT